MRRRKRSKGRGSGVGGSPSRRPDLKDTKNESTGVLCKRVSCRASGNCDGTHGS